MTMNLIVFIKQWSLPVAIFLGTTIYLLFSQIDMLAPVGDAVGPLLTDLLPYIMFVILYVTFCKIQMHDMRPRKWHMWLQLIRIGLSCLLVWAISLTTDIDTKLILEGVFICIICPTAAAAAVVTEKLGGSIASLTIFTIIDNVATSIVIPLLFPLVEKEADIPFLATSLAVLRNVTIVLVAPLVVALLTRRFAPRFNDRVCRTRNLGFYLWCINLAIVTGLTIHNIIYSSVSHHTLLWLLILPLGVTLGLFAIGKSTGRPYGENISAGQAMGQKNTVVAIWLTVSFLNPLAAVAPGAYVIWQNAVNAWQIWYKEKYGRVKW